MLSRIDDFSKPTHDEVRMLRSELDEVKKALDEIQGRIVDTHYDVGRVSDVLEKLQRNPKAYIGNGTSF